MTDKSLNQIMNDMATGFNIPCLAVVVVPKKLCEFDAFVTLDDVLQTLNKEYLDAKAQHDYLKKTFGRDDAMAEVAADMEDSAWCAMQTRYLEVRADSYLMEQAQRLIRESIKACEEAREKKAQEKSIEQGARLVAVARYIEKMREINKGSSDYLWAAVVLLFGMLRLENMGFVFRSRFNSYGQYQLSG